ncbi:MAG: uroporphyrinogen-III synthase [bacterium]
MTGEKSDLSGRTILITRAKDQAGELASLLERRGASVAHLPLIKTLPPEDTGPLDDAIRRLGDYDLVVFTSANGVRRFFRRAEEIGAPAARTAAKFAAVGPKTAAALEEHGAAAFAVPEQFTGAAAAGMFEPGRLAGKRVLLPRADVAGGELPALLIEKGALVDEVTAYRTVPDDELRDSDSAAMELLAAGAIDCVVFMSPSAVKSFIRKTSAVPRDAYSRAAVACIGPVTAEAAREAGLAPRFTARSHTIESLVEEIAQYLKGNHAGGAG